MAMGSQNVGFLCCVLSCFCAQLTGSRALSPYIRHYEGLSYDRQKAHEHHLLTKRAAGPHQDHMLQLDFTAFHREFRMRLRRDTSGFSEGFRALDEKGAVAANLSHLYSGTLEGEHGASCHGSLLQGQFEGSVSTANGTYHIEPLSRYTSTPAHHHSIIYHEDDMVLPSSGTAPSGFCGADGLQLRAQQLRLDEGAPVNRSRRTTDESKTSCMLHLHADHLYFNKFRSVQAVVAQVSLFMRAVNDIYDKVDFEGIKLINFKVKSLTVVTEEDSDDPLQRPYIGPEKLLSLYSESNWGNYCLSYLLTNRDYSGILGLAWEGKTGNWGGICSQYTTLRDGSKSTLNTGLVTLQNYGTFLPPRLFQLTLAHELGHSLGAPHDEGPNCGHLGSTGGKGRFLMFPKATDEVRENNGRFSPCSIKHMSRTLRLLKDSCFVVSNLPICGNLMVEDGEECDVGHDEADPCCYSAQQAAGRQCTLKPGKVCSPSQGLCCGQACTFRPAGENCDEATECQRDSVCSGVSPVCPEPGPKENFTECSLNTRVCLNGHCAESLCVKHGLQQCDCPGVSMAEKCQMCCQQPDEPDTCASTTSSVLARYFERRSVTLLPGSPCADNRGYCNRLQVCRLLYADGPIARLKNSFLNLNEFDDPAEWMKAYWWVILLALLLLSAVMGCTICVCGRSLDTSYLD